MKNIFCSILIISLVLCGVVSPHHTWATQNLIYSTTRNGFSNIPQYQYLSQLRQLQYNNYPYRFQPVYSLPPRFIYNPYGNYPGYPGGLFGNFVFQQNPGISFQNPVLGGQQRPLPTPAPPQAPSFSQEELPTGAVVSDDTVSVEAA